MKVGIVSSFRAQCGVALHTENIVSETIKLVDSLKIFAEYITPPDKELPSRFPELQIDYERCWYRDAHLELLKTKILEYSPDIVEIEFNSGFFLEWGYQINSPFQKFVADLKSNNIKIIFYVHDVPTEFPYPPQLHEWYKKIDVPMMVGNSSLVGGIKRWYPEADVHIMRTYVPKTNVYKKDVARQKLNLKQEDFLITQTGFYSTDKGMKELIETIPDIHIPNLKIVFAGGIHPFAFDDNRMYIKNCIQAAIKNKVTDKIVFVNKSFLTKEEFELYCSATDFFIFNMASLFGLGGSMSGGLATPFGKPILTSKSTRLLEFTDEVNCKKFNSDQLAETVMNVYKDKEMQKKISEGALNMAQELSAEKSAKRIVELYQKCLSKTCQ